MGREIGEKNIDLASMHGEYSWEIQKAGLAIDGVWDRGRKKDLVSMHVGWSPWIKIIFL